MVQRQPLDANDAANLFCLSRYVLQYMCWAQIGLTTEFFTPVTCVPTTPIHLHDRGPFVVRQTRTWSDSLPVVESAWRCIRRLIRVPLQAASRPIMTRPKSASKAKPVRHHHCVRVFPLPQLTESSVVTARESAVVTESAALVCVQGPRPSLEACARTLSFFT